MAISSIRARLSTIIWVIDILIRCNINLKFVHICSLFITYLFSIFVYICCVLLQGPSAGVAVHLSPHFRSQGTKMSNMLHKMKWSPSITVCKIVNLSRIGWTVIEKSRPEHDPKWTRLCDLQPTGSSWWRHFQSTGKDYWGLWWVLNLEVASSRSFRDFPKRSICDGEVGDGSGGVKSICSRPTVTTGSIWWRHFQWDVKTFREYVCLHLWVQPAVFEKIKISH